MILSYLEALYALFDNWSVFNRYDTFILFIFLILLFFPPYIIFTLFRNHLRNKIIDFFEMHDPNFLKANRVIRISAINLLLGINARNDLRSFLSGNLTDLPELPDLKYIQNIAKKMFVLYLIRGIYAVSFFLSFALFAYLRVRSEESLIFLGGVLLGLFLSIVTIIVFIYNRTKHR